MRLNVLSARSTLFALVGHIPRRVARGCRTGGARWIGDRGRRRHRHGARRVRSGHPCLVRRGLRRAHRRTDRRLAVRRRRAQRPRGGAHRLGQDARGLPLVTGPVVPRTGTARGPPAVPRALRQPAQGPGRRRGTQPARPLAGIRQAATRLGVAPPDITVGMRTGDTPADERRAFARTPPDILITTPESLFLLLTSAARDCCAASRR